MASVNKVIIVGNLGADPEVRQFPSGGSVTHINVATSERWTDKQTGQPREQTEWHRISLFNRLGEIAAQYLRKGSSVYIEGSLHTRKYTDQQGIERYSTEIKAQSMQMLGGSSYGSRSDGQQEGGFSGGYQNPPTYQNNVNASAQNFNTNTSSTFNSGGQNWHNQNPAFGGQSGYHPSNVVGHNQAPQATTTNTNQFMNNPPTAQPSKVITPPPSVADDDMPF